MLKQKLFILFMLHYFIFLYPSFQNFFLPLIFKNESFTKEKRKHFLFSRFLNCDKASSFSLMHENKGENVLFCFMPMWYLFKNLSLECLIDSFYGEKATVIIGKLLTDNLSPLLLQNRGNKKKTSLILGYRYTDVENP